MCLTRRLNDPRRLKKTRANKRARKNNEMCKCSQRVDAPEICELCGKQGDDACGDGRQFMILFQKMHMFMKEK